jgi:hypothetical protein
MSEQPRARVVGWILLALAGLALAVALSLAASNLSTQPIGLSGEPLRAGDRLAPQPVTRTTTARKPAKRRVKRPKRAVTKTTTTPAATAAPTVTAPAPTTTGDDHGGSRSRGRGGGSDD